MSDAYERGRENLKLLAEFSSKPTPERNESTTRLHLINRLFLECLGWDLEDIITEEPQEGEYADYTFHAPRKLLIVEAKREGSSFELPAGKNSINVSIRTLLRTYKNLKEAMEQASGYCQQRGVPFCAIANGHQLVAFVAVRSDGIAPFDGKALVFDSFESMLNNFYELWQALSKPGIEDKHLLNTLVGNTPAELPPKLSAKTYGYPGVKGRNPFQADFQVLAEIVIEDLIKSQELEGVFLKECYCDSGALSQHSLISKAVLKNRYAALFDVNSQQLALVPANQRKGISLERLSESLSRRPILLIGDVGVGKTTFTRHLVKVSAVEEFKKSITFEIDLGSKAMFSKDIRDFVLEEVKTQLFSHHGIDIEEKGFVRAVYRVELEQFAKSIYGELKESDPSAYKIKELELLEKRLTKREEHLNASLRHISKSQRKQIVMFVDNADQRLETVQQQAFLIAQELAEHWPITVFVALRPETFYRSVRTGALTGYHPKAFTIPPPRVNQVIEKRLQFALQITGGKMSLTQLPTFEFQLEKLTSIIKVFLNSIQRDDSLRECIDNISGGNVRLALNLVSQFFGSGHVNTEKIVRLYEQLGKYHVPLHEFLRAVIYGDSIYFAPGKSPITNIFDVAHSGSNEHFGLPMLLGLLSTAQNSNENGFVETTDLYNQLQGLGFIPDQIDSLVLRGHRGKLIDVTSRVTPLASDVPTPRAFRISSVGAYHIKRLCHSFTYIDAIIIDTPVFDPNVRSRITADGILSRRLEQVDEFRAYLDQQWRIFDGIETTFNWPEVSLLLHEDITRVRQAAGF